MPNHQNNSRGDSEDSGLAIALIAGLILLVVTGGILFEVWLLYLPVKKMSKGNTGRLATILGVILIVAGSVIMAYQLLAGDAAVEYIDRTTALPWLVLLCGTISYFNGLILSFSYKSKLSQLQLKCRNLALNGEFVPEQIEAARRLGKNFRIAPADSEAIIYQENHVNSLAIVKAGGMPNAECPESIFLDINEECLVVLIGATLCKDVLGTQYTSQGITAYFRASNRTVLAPSSFTAKSMPTKELQSQDVGYVLMTSKRVLFQGNSYRLEFPYEEIEGLSEYDDGFQLQFAGKSERQIFRTHGVDSYLAASLIRQLAMSHRLQ